MDSKVDEKMGATMDVKLVAKVDSIDRCKTQHKSGCKKKCNS